MSRSSPYRYFRTNPDVSLETPIAACLSEQITFPPVLHCSQGCSSHGPQYAKAQHAMDLVKITFSSDFYGERAADVACQKEGGLTTPVFSQWIIFCCIPHTATNTLPKCPHELACYIRVVLNVLGPGQWPIQGHPQIARTDQVPGGLLAWTAS